MHHIAVHAGDGDDDDDDGDDDDDDDDDGDCGIQCVFVNGHVMTLRKILSSLQNTISVQDVIFKMINYGGDDVDSSLMLSSSP